MTSHDDWLTEADLDALVDGGQIEPVAQAPVARLAGEVVAQLERTLSGLGQAIADIPWASDVDALAAVRERVERLAYVSEDVALPALDGLLRLLDQAGQPDFGIHLGAWCTELDRTLGERT